MNSFVDAMEKAQIISPKRAGFERFKKKKVEYYKQQFLRQGLPEREALSEAERRFEQESPDDQRPARSSQ